MQTPHLAQPYTASEGPGDFGRHAGARNRDPLAGCDREGVRETAHHFRRAASRSGVASKQTALGTCSALRGICTGSS